MINSSDDKEENESTHEHTLNSTDYILLFVIISFCLAILCREVYLRTKIPYTPLIVIVGVILGAFSIFGYFNILKI